MSERTLPELRAEIDTIDDQLVDLLERRAELAVAVGQQKRGSLQLHDPEREQRVIERLEARIEGQPAPHFPASAVRPVFREVMSACLALEQPQSVAYFGPAGTFTHMAARAAFGDAARYVETSTIPGVFDAVLRKSATYGVVPMENSTEGSVTFTLDSFLECDVSIRRELVLDVAQCLCARHDDLARIERVHSHPQALAQCRRWLAENLPHAELVSAPSTSAAARQAAGDNTVAAVASRLAAELCGLTVLRDRIQDRVLNATRFVVLADRDAPPTGSDKTSLVFSAPDERGALKRVLAIFDDHGINLSRIESRPAGDTLWKYVFFTDLEGHRESPEVARALERLRELCGMVKLLGSYPKAAPGAVAGPA